MDLFDAVETRRSIKRFTDRDVPREDIERLIDAAIQVPNHRLTEPWRFAVLGERSREAYARRRGVLKAQNAFEGEARAVIEEKVYWETAAVPAIIAVLSAVDEDPIVHEEDLAAVWMAIQNLSLAATALGLGTHIRTGGVTEDWEVQKIVGAAPGERLCALVYLGAPAETPDPKPRTDAGERTTWLD
ncbi:MAG TPA: nitroreductase [Longimicrobiales bacterium]|nr:nitroreductase [Longimicrobiales bacterium]